jgi:hypothetical protein
VNRMKNAAAPGKTLGVLTMVVWCESVGWEKRRFARKKY